MESEKEVLSRLKFIGMIQKGDKINVKHLYIETTGFLTSLYRTFFYPCSRFETITFVSNTIYRSFDIYKKVEEEKKAILCINILIDLRKAEEGLKNLRETYIYDIKFTCDVDVLIQDIEIKLNELEN